jgi:integrase
LRRGGFATRAAAEQARAYWLGSDVEPDLSLVTVGQWLDIWLEARQTLRPATRNIYTQLIRDYIKPRLGGVPLRDRDMTVGKVQAMFTALLRANAKRAHPLAPATFQRIREVLRAALNGAIRRGLIGQNPARWVEVPSVRRPQAVVWTDARVAVWRATGQRPAVAVWTAAQTAAFLAHVRGHVLYPLFHVAALLGLRRGEVIGLRWSDVDFTAGTLTVCRQVQERHGRAVVCLLKSERSGRTIALDHDTLSLLRRLHTGWEVATGRATADGWLFTHDGGRHWSPSYISHTFRRLIREADLPPVRFHDLRHGAASLSLAAGNDLKIVQALLGHASIVLTADTYTSVLPCLAHQAAEATAELVRRADRKRWHRPPGHTRPKKRRTTARKRRGIKRAHTRETVIARSHSGHTSGSQITNAHQHDPLDLENPLVGVDVTKYAARDSNPEPAG